LSVRNTVNQKHVRASSSQNVNRCEFAFADLFCPVLFGRFNFF
jgi:hypothetical protein